MIERSQVRVPAGAAEEFSSPGPQGQLSVLTVISVSVPLHVKDTGYSAKSAGGRLQLNTHTPYVCGFAWSDMVHGCIYVIWLYGVWCTQNLRRDGSSFTWHQPCQRCKYTTLVDIQNSRYKKLVVHVEPHASAVSLLESGALYKSDQQQRMPVPNKPYDFCGR